MKNGIPYGMTINSNYDGLKIEHRWFSTETLFLTPFVIVWDVFWFQFYGDWYGSLGEIIKMNAVILLFPLVQLAVGIFLSYYVVASYLNKTNISVDRSFVESSVSPIPFGFKKRIPSSLIFQVYRKAIVRSSNTGATGMTFEVWVILKDSKNIRLVSGLKTSEQALFLQNEIESYLGINRPLKNSPPPV